MLLSSKVGNNSLQGSVFENLSYLRGG